MLGLFGFAAANALAEFGPRRPIGSRRRTKGHSHWSFWDEPEKALCGEYITPEDFDRDPTCPTCQAKLAAMKAEELR